MPQDESTADSQPVFRPLYGQIKRALIERLAAGEWRPGEAIPSETDLAERFKVSQGTVRKAIDELAAEHHLVRRQGKGTFVATHHEPRTQFRFLRLTPDEGDLAQLDSRLIECKRARVSAEVARLLEIRAGDSIVWIRRLLLTSIEAQPVVLDDISLPATMFRGLDAAKFNQHRGSMYGLFESEFGVRMVRATERVRAIAADSGLAASLDVPIGAPLLSVDRVAFTYGDKPVEYRRGVYRTDHYHYRNELS